MTTNTPTIETILAKFFSVAENLAFAIDNGSETEIQTRKMILWDLINRAETVCDDDDILREMIELVTDDDQLKNFIVQTRY